MSAPGSARAYLGACAAMIGFALAYALPTYGKLTNLFYDPVARRFFVAERPGSPIPMGYYGLLCWGTAGALVGGGIVLLVFRRRAPSDQTVALAGLWALTALVIVAAYFTWNNWP